jgi:uncharacterized protein (DUF1810 family)
MVAPEVSLARFVEAQSGVWDDVLAQLRAGHKTSHWMWFVFPQLRELGRSGTARFYGLRDLGEARSYVEHELLGARIVQCCELVEAHSTRSAVDIFGEVDAMKLRSCLTLFAQAAPEQAVFRRCLDRFFDGKPDPLTLQGVRR